MAINIDNALGDYARNLQVYSRRSELLASNLANADTPGYKARDVDFKSMLEKAGGDNLQLASTRAGHLGSGAASGRNSVAGLDSEVLYRTPTQPTLDGNTVDTHIEQSEFARNAMRYQATLTFLTGKIKGLMLAIKGE